MLAAAPSWAMLAEIAKQAAAAIGAEVMTAAGRRGGSEDGAPSAQARLRTFGEGPASVRVTLYRDTHAWCPWGLRSVNPLSSYQSCGVQLTREVLVGLGTATKYGCSSKRSGCPTVSRRST